MAYNYGIYGSLKSDALSAYEEMGIDAVFADVEVNSEGKKISAGVVYWHAHMVKNKKVPNTLRSRACFS